MILFEVLIIVLACAFAYLGGRADEQHWQRYIRGEVRHRITKKFISPEEKRWHEAHKYIL